jgi:cysteine desulfurase / selenocysteine lyase
MKDSLPASGAGMNLTEVKREFPILAASIGGRAHVYLDSAATTQKPRIVLEAIRSFYSESNANIHRGAHALAERASQAYEAARESVRDLINARHAHECVFTYGTTDSINLLAESFGRTFIHAGDEILVTEMEHHSNLVPWQELCRRTGAVLTVLPMDDDGRLRTDRVGAAMSQRTKLVCVTHVSNVTGIINPITEIVAQARSRGVPVLVDGAQASAHLRVDVQALGCDFYAFSGHKAYAETGIGVLYGREDWLERMPPHRFGGGMVATVDYQRATFAAPPAKFEAGTPNIAGAVSLGAAASFIKMLGQQAIAEHESRVLAYANEALSSLDGIVVYGRAAPNRCGSLSFNLRGANPYDVGVILDQLGVAVRTGSHCAQPMMRRLGIEGTVRASFAVYSDRDDVDRLVAALAHASKMLL